MSLDIYIKQCTKLINTALNDKFPSDSKKTTKLQDAMKYSVLNGGKRLRSIFSYTISELFHVDKEVATDLCCAIEMIHAASLIYDDLPSLDNDDLRRGVPSCHIAYGEATAILAGDALHNMAYEVLSRINKISNDKIVSILQYMSNAVGAAGLAGGEELDLELVGKTLPDIDEIEKMYALKTGCLLSASIVLPAIAGGCHDQNRLNHLEQFGSYLGISFQIHDDIIGIESDTSLLGKKQNADIDLKKPVYPVLVGIEAAKIRRNELYKLALSHLTDADCSSERLIALSRNVIERNH